MSEHKIKEQALRLGLVSECSLSSRTRYGLITVIYHHGSSIRSWRFKSPEGRSPICHVRYPLSGESQGDVLPSLTCTQCQLSVSDIPLLFHPITSHPLYYHRRVSHTHTHTHTHTQITRTKQQSKSPQNSMMAGKGKQVHTQAALALGKLLIWVYPNKRRLNYGVERAALCAPLSPSRPPRPRDPRHARRGPED